MSATVLRPSPSAALRESGRSSGLVSELRSLALSGLSRMYVPDEGLFVFRLRRNGADVVAEGTSRRYTAISLIGLSTEAPEQARSALQGQDAHDVCRHLLGGVAAFENPGDVALALWAGVAFDLPERRQALDRLRTIAPDNGVLPTVELAWALTALSLDPGSPEADMRARIAARLLGAFDPGSGLFPHVLGKRGSRSHVCCFADLVYPIQALSHYARATGDSAALEAARRCAEAICRLQGSAGQWWWHYDVRSGRVVEGYPVYSVHQDSMAPMALFAIEEAGGGDFGAGTQRGLDWLRSSPELNGDTLIDRRAGLIWRKVARREPRKLARYLQAAASRLSPSLRVPGLDVLLPARVVDAETRPYHLGWILHAFPPARADRW